jgi:hypothetical protein
VTYLILRYSKEAHACASLLVSDNGVNDAFPKTTILYMPNQIPQDLPVLPAHTHLLKVESKLHFSQATNALAMLHCALSVFAHLCSYKIQEVQGQ